MGLTSSSEEIYILKGRAHEHRKDSQLNTNFRSAKLLWMEENNHNSPKGPKSLEDINDKMEARKKTSACFPKVKFINLECLEFLPDD